MDTPSFRRLIEAVEGVLYAPPELEELFFRRDSGVVEIITEGWIKSPSGNQIRVDQPKHGGGGQIHGHIYGRKGDEIGVVNLNGTGSHGTKMRLNKKDAEVLRQNGFTIRKDRVVEWIVEFGLTRQLLLG